MDIKIIFSKQFAVVNSDSVAKLIAVVDKEIANLIELLTKEDELLDSTEKTTVADINKIAANFQNTTKIILKSTANVSKVISGVKNCIRTTASGIKVSLEKLRVELNGLDVSLSKEVSLRCLAEL